jgi:hypothetical protein
MNYTPQTNWIGGHYPGVLPPHMHHTARAHRATPQKPFGYKRKAIVAYVCGHGPVSAVDIAQAVGYPIDSVRGQLRTACNQKQVVKEERLHPNRRNRIMFYTGAPL